MEELKSYMASGALELYVIGALEPGERLEVERMADAHAEIRKELHEIELALQKYCEAYAIDPTTEALKSRVLTAMSPVASSARLEKSEAVVVSMKPSSSFYKYAFAACLALLMLSSVSLVVIYNRLQSSRAAYTSLLSANRQFASNANYLQRELDEQKEIVSVLSDSNFRFVDLKGTGNAPKAAMKVAFNAKKQEVMIDMASMDMPVNDKEHQYQLWAMVDGKPVDLGVFDRSDSTGMKKMKAIAHAQAFAVTLEPRGGSVNPTLSQLMVIGTI